LSILFNFLFASPWLLMMLLFHMNFGAISFIFGKKPYWDFHRIYRKGACLLHKFFKKIILTLGLRFFLFFFFSVLTVKAHTNWPAGISLYLKYEV
jgi:hypothetical protein